MAELDASIKEKIINDVKQHLGIDKDPVSVEYVEAMDMVTLKFSDADSTTTEETEINGHLAVIEKAGDEIVEVAYMGVIDLLNS